VAGLIHDLERTIAARSLFLRGERILVAVSGGVDSMVLLHLLWVLSRKHDWKLAVAHLNHKLRGRESDADERLVHRVTRKLHLRLVSEHADVRALASERGISIEMAARALRHDFLARTAERLKISTVALAHHADDQLELFFIRLMRGSGAEGLSGMKWRAPSPADANIELVRPLLDVRKADLKKYARANRVVFREDKSNASLDFQRNRIRHELLPLLTRKYQPALATSIQRVIEIVGAESQLAKEAAQKWLRRKTGAQFDKLPVAVQRWVLQLQLVADAIAPEFELIERLRCEPGKKVSIGPGISIQRNANGRMQTSRVAAPAGFQTTEKKVDLKKVKRIDFNGARIRCKIEQQKGFRRPIVGQGRELFDADKVGSRIVLRHWRAGDRFQPIGMSSAVKLQDLFTNAKIPRDLRGKLMLATTSRGEIFWVEQMRIAEGFKLTPQTARRLRWSWKAARADSAVAT